MAQTWYDLPKCILEYPFVSLFFVYISQADNVSEMQLALLTTVIEDRLDNPGLTLQQAAFGNLYWDL